MVVRKAGLEPASPEWRSGVLPLNYVRFGCAPRNRTGSWPDCNRLRSHLARAQLATHAGFEPAFSH